MTVYGVFLSIEYEGEQMLGLYKTLPNAEHRVEEERNAFGNGKDWKKNHAPGGFIRYAYADYELYIKELELYE